MENYNENELNFMPKQVEAFDPYQHLSHLSPEVLDILTADEQKRRETLLKELEEIFNKQDEEEEQRNAKI